MLVGVLTWKLGMNLLLGKWTIELGNNEGKDLLQLLFDVDVGPKVAR